MASKPNDPVYEMRMRKQRELERVVLRHPKEHQDKPLKFDRLYFLFSGDGTADIAPALEELRHWAHININNDNTVTITDAGLERLDRYD
jgi:hypothetical protein